MQSCKLEHTKKASYDKKTDLLQIKTKRKIEKIKVLLVNLIFSISKGCFCNTNHIYFLAQVFP